MKGKILIDKKVDDLTSTNDFEFNDGEYLEMLKNYEGIELDVMLGKKAVEYNFKECEHHNFIKNKYDNTLFSCECEVLDSENDNVLTCYEFFNVVYNKKDIKYLTLLLNYDTCEEEFQEELQEWLYDSERLMKTVTVFGKGMLPKKDFYFELVNDANEKLLLEFSNTFLIKKELNKITIGIDNIKIVQKN